MSDAAAARTSDWSAEETARHLMRCARRGALATLDQESGAPYASLVAVATAADGSPTLLLSRLARHTRNLESDARASIMLATEGEGDPLALPRVTVLGRLAVTEEASARARWLARHREAAGYAGFADFAIWQLEVESAHLVAGFGRIVDLPARALLTDTGDATELIEAEQRIADHMNEDHADAVRLYATRLLGAPDGEWRFDGCDPDGIEMSMAGQVRRLDFERRALSPTEVRLRLVELSKRARGG